MATTAAADHVALQETVCVVWTSIIAAYKFRGRIGDTDACMALLQTAVTTYIHRACATCTPLLQTAITMRTGSAQALHPVVMAAQKVRQQLGTHVGGALQPCFQRRVDSWVGSAPHTRLRWRAGG